MNPVFETINEKKLVGQRLKMSMSGNKTADLWKKFMPERDKIKNSVITSYSIHYTKLYELRAANSFRSWEPNPYSNAYY